MPYPLLLVHRILISGVIAIVCVALLTKLRPVSWAFTHGGVPVALAAFAVFAPVAFLALGWVAPGFRKSEKPSLRTDPTVRIQRVMISGAIALIGTVMLIKGWRLSSGHGYSTGGFLIPPIAFLLFTAIAYLGLGLAPHFRRR